ncbi:MAG: hypothetical protein JXA13_14000 [Anaerolineales bacterium]|nr:hypothetical protein [Anaerolineales bacterium]
MVLSLAGWSSVRLGASITHWKILEEVAPTPGPGYIAASGVFWLLAAVPTAWALWQNNPRARTAVMLVSLGFAGWYWIDRLALQTSRPDWPFALSITILVLVIIFFIVFNRRTILFFTQREAHERQS